LPQKSPRLEAASWWCDANGERFYVVVPRRVLETSAVIEVVTRFQELVSRK